MYNKLMNKSRFNQFVADGYNNIPVYKKLIIDTDTALGLYLKLANNDYSYLFESVQGAEKWSRYSIIGLKADTIIKIFDYTITLQQNNQKTTIQTDNPLDWIEEYQTQFNTPTIEELGDFSGGLVGYFGYETIRYIEPKLKNINNTDKLNTPDILLMLSNDLLVFDNLHNSATIISHINPQLQSFEDAIAKIQQIEQNIQNIQIENNTHTANIQQNDFIANFAENDFKNCVNKIKQYITSGDCMQVVPSQRLSCDFTIPAIELYRKLRVINPSPYMYYLNLKDFQIVGSSPEILAKITLDKKATVRPLAGSRPRGANEVEDKKLEKELLADEKEIAEHLMLIDLGRNDLGKISKTGKVVVSDKMQIERYSHVMHIVSNVECEVQDNLTNIDVLKATFPAGTLSGAPKIRAMQIIDEIESIKRNIYAGAVGYLGFNGTMDTAIAIRTAVIKDGKLHIQAGAGIVFDSNPQAEWNETMHKAHAIIKAAIEL